MFRQGVQTGTKNQSALSTAASVSNWSVALYRKAEPILPLNPTDGSQTSAVQQTYGSFYVQLQYQASSSSPGLSDVLYFRYQAQQQNNSATTYTLPFTVSQLSDMKLSPDTVTSASTRFTNIEQHTGRIIRQCPSMSTRMKHRLTCLFSCSHLHIRTIFNIDRNH
jgi:hypothetical protein